MSTVEAIGIIAAALVTVFATAVAARPNMSANQKRLIAGLFAAVLGIIATVITGGIEGIPATFVAWISQALVTVALVIVAAQGFHAAFKGVLDNVEEASTPRRAIQDDSTDEGHTLPRSFGEIIKE